MSATPHTLVHPGEILREELRARGVDAAHEWAWPHANGIHAGAFYDVLNGSGPIDENMAERLAAALGTSVELWINLQRNFDEAEGAS